MKYNNQFCSICEIVGEDKFFAGPPKSLYILCKSFSLRFTEKKPRNNLCILPHDTYVLFRTFFSQVNNKRFSFTTGCPQITPGSKSLGCDRSHSTNKEVTF